MTVNGKAAGMGFAWRQLTGALVGGLLLLLLARIDYSRWRRWAWPLLGVTVVLLLIPLLPFTHAISPTINGARRWVDAGPINFQPSELARLAVVIWCAMLASKKGEQVREFKKGVLPFMVMLGLVAVLIGLEPNLSMATLVALLGGIVLFASGAKIGHFLILAAVGVMLVFHRIADAQYRLARVHTFLNPGQSNLEGGFQIHQSLVGIGSGRLFGVGFGQGQQKLGYLPYAYSDFLFSTIGEEWGFLGVCLVVALFALFCWLGFRIAQDRRRSVRPVPRGGPDRDGGAHGLHAHGGVAGPHADHGAHAAVHVLRPVEPGDLAGGHRDPHQHRTAAMATGGGSSAGDEVRSEG